MLRATIAALYLVYCIAMYSILFLSVLQLTIIFFLIHFLFMNFLDNDNLSAWYETIFVY